MSKKPDRKSLTVKAKSKKVQIRTEKIENAVLKFVKTNRGLDINDLEDTVDNIE